ncbi:MAG TPA: zinc dependent phospholipase C family protein [Myxococcota bacterium]|nr:zinc dependent phospholipase C family protein [Myxococcota bacterium]
MSVLFPRIPVTPLKTIFLFLFVLLVLLPTTALAFGPVAHVDMALEILSWAGMVGGSLGGLIARYRRHFILGTLDPDRTLAKNLATYEDHSHNWDTAIDQFRSAQSDQERARSLGRICHLAADVVAHNYFVPKKIVDSVESRGAGHFFWEVRFDARLREIRGQDELESLSFNDREEIRYLSTMIRPTVATKNLNARLTGVAMKLQKAGPYMAATRTLDRRSNLDFTDAEVMDIREMAMQAQVVAIGSLTESDAIPSPIFELDPRGISCIRQSQKVRAELRRSVGVGDLIVGRQLRQHEFFRNLVTSKLQS